MTDITHIFDEILSQHSSIDIAESEFKMQMYASPEIHSEYKEWCKAEGFTEKSGFLEYCYRYMEDQREIWESLHDYENYE